MVVLCVQLAIPGPEETYSTLLRLQHGYEDGGRVGFGGAVRDLGRNLGAWGQVELNVWHGIWDWFCRLGMQGFVSEVGGLEVFDVGLGSICGS